MISALEIQMFANLARLQQDMDKAKGVVTSTMGSIDKAVSVAKTALNALGIGLSVNYFKNLVVGAIDAADRLNDLHKTTGLTVETLSGLSLAAQQSGSNLDGTAKLINKLGKEIAANGDKFKALGISAKDPLEAFKQLSDAFVKMQDPQKRSLLMTEALGQSWEAAAPLLAEGGARIQEMIDRGIDLSGVTTKMAEDADALNDAWAELEAAGDGLLNRAIAPLIAGMTDAVKAAIAFQESGDLAKWANRTVIAVEILAAVFVARMIPALLAFTASAIASASAFNVLNLSMLAVVGTQKTMVATLALFGGAGGLFFLASAGAIAFTTSLEDLEERTVRLRKEMGDLTDAQRKNLIAMAQAEAESARATIARLEARSHGYAAETRAIQIQQARLDEIIQRIAEYQSAIDGGSEKTEESTDAINKNADALRDLYGIYTPLTISAESYLRLMVESGAHWEANTKDIKDLRAATNDFGRSAVRVGDQSAEAAEQAAREWMEFRNTFSDGLADMMMDGGNVFDNIAKSFERMLYKMAGDLMASGIMSFLTGKSGGFSLAGSLAGAGATGTITSAVLAKYAPSLAAALKLPSFNGGTVLTDAQRAALNLPSEGGTGFSLGSLKTTAMNIGAGIAGSYAGNAVGEALFKKEAESAWGATIGGTIGSIWGPIGAFVGSALGGLVDVAFGGDGKTRSNSGFLAAPTPGLKDQYNMGQHEFASGLKVTVFSRRSDPSAANEIVNTFDQVDQSFTDLVKALGGNLKVSQLSGLDEEANPGSRGTFFGIGGNGTTQGDILAQVNSYVDQLADHVTGLDEALLESIRSATSAEQALQLLAVAVTEKAALDARVKINTEANAALQERINALTIRGTDLLKKQRDALDDAGRALFDQVQSLEALASLPALAVSLASAQSGVRAALRSVGDEVRSLADDAESAADDLASAQQRIVDLNREAANELRAFGKTIDEFLAGLSPGSHGMSLANLKGQLTATGALAGAGDKDAQARLLTQAQMVLRSAETASVTRADYVRTEAFVRSVLLAARGEIVPESTAVAGPTQLDVAKAELAAAVAANTAAQAAYANAQALTANLTLPGSSALGGLVSALSDLAAANSEAYSAQQAFAAAQKDAGIVTDELADSFELTTDEAGLLASALGLTGKSAQDLINALTDPTSALKAFTSALSDLTPAQVAALFATGNQTLLAQIPAMFTGAAGALNSVISGLVSLIPANSPVYGPVAPPPKPVDPWITEPPAFITPAARSAPVYGPVNPNSSSTAIVAELRALRGDVAALQAPMNKTADASERTAGITEQVATGAMSLTTVAA